MTDNTNAGPGYDDPVSLFKDAFGFMTTDISRSAALGRIMQDPTGFVEALAGILGPFSVVTQLNKILESDSAPERLKKAVMSQLHATESLNTRLNLAKEKQLQIVSSQAPQRQNLHPEDLRNRDWMDVQARKRQNEKLRLAALPVFALHNGKLRPMLVFSAYRR